MKKQKEPVSPDQLESIRNSIRETDEKRTDPQISAEERKVLELAAVTLREAERVAESALRNQSIEKLTESVARLQETGRAIRARVTRMNKIPKALDHIEQTIGGIVTVLKSIAKW